MPCPTSSLLSVGREADGVTQGEWPEQKDTEIKRGLRSILQIYYPGSFKTVTGDWHLDGHLSEGRGSLSDTRIKCVILFA